VACAAAVAVQEVIQGEKLLDNVQAMGALLEQRLTERLGNHRHVGDIRGRGLFWAVELVQDRASKAVFDPALKLPIDGRSGDHVLLAPPFIAGAPDIDAIVERLGEAIDAATMTVASAALA